MTNIIADRLEAERLAEIEAEEREKQIPVAGDAELDENDSLRNQMNPVNIFASEEDGILNNLMKADDSEADANR